MNWIETKIEHNTSIDNKKCVVVIPVYKTNLKLFEEYSLKQGVSVLGEKYEIVLVCPSDLDVSHYNKIAEYNFSVLRCNPEYFKSQKSYSDMCEEWQFYDAFSEYEFMVIYQLDAWIFEDRLDYFINLDYDYIGAIHLIGIAGKNREGECGNGGFCIRKIKPFIDVCKKTNFKSFHRLKLEDCVFTQDLKQNFKLAPLDICREFSFQEKPDLQFVKNGNKLPMGCHAWMKFGRYFWKKYILPDKWDEMFVSPTKTADNIITTIYGSNTVSIVRKIDNLRNKKVIRKFGK